MGILSWLKRAGGPEGAGRPSEPNRHQDDAAEQHPAPKTSRSADVVQAFGGLLARSGFLPSPWQVAGGEDHMRDVDSRLSPEEVAERRSQYERMTEAERAATWGEDI